MNRELDLFREKLREEISRSTRFERMFVRLIDISPAFALTAGIAYISGFLWARIYAGIVVLGAFLSMFEMRRRRRVIDRMIRAMDDERTVKDVLDS